MKRKKKAGVAILIPDKIDFKTKAITRDKQELSYPAQYLSEKTQNTTLKQYVNCMLILMLFTVAMIWRHPGWIKKR